MAMLPRDGIAAGEGHHRPIYWKPKGIVELVCAVTAVVSSLYGLQTRHCAKVPHQSDTGNVWQTQLSARCLFLPRLLQRHTEKRLGRVQASTLTNTVLTNHLRIKVHKMLQLHRRLWYADATPRCARRLQLYELANFEQPTVK